MALPKMIRVRQTFLRPRVADIPTAETQTLGAAALRVKPGDSHVTNGRETTQGGRIR